MLEKKICSLLDLSNWKKSEAYNDIVSFLEIVSKAISHKKINPSITTSDCILRLKNLIKFIFNAIDNFPLIEQPQRFGNKAFRAWYDWLQNNAMSLCKEFIFLPVTSTLAQGDTPIEDGLIEISTYFVESFGNPIRIDYGTGHELAFIAFLICLFKMKILLMSPIDTRNPSTIGLVSDLVGVGLVIMPEYLSLVRKLQTFYRMEPAGSHGVWSLDDFQFVPFIWGSSQLYDNPSYGPSSICDQITAEREKDAYLLFSCINYIYQVKTGPFQEHSNTLCSISELPHWQKVNSGLVKMYKGEVLDKFPVVQHFLFGKLLTMNIAKPQVYRPVSSRFDSCMASLTSMSFPAITTQIESSNCNKIQDSDKQT